MRRSTEDGPVAAKLRVPRLSIVGGFGIVVGLVLDLVQHTVVDHHHEAVLGAFPVGEHAAHLVVLIGMVLVLAGIVADGVRTQRRQVRLEGSSRDATR
jgi:hypothetical protein